MSDASPDSEAHKQPGLRRILAWLAALVFVLLAAGGWYYLRDGPKADDSDLRITLSNVADRDNGYAALRNQLSNNMDFSEYAGDKGLPDEKIYKIMDGLERDDATVDSYLAQMQPDIAKLDSILKLPRFELTGNVSMVDLPEVGKIKSVSQSLKLSAMRSQQKANYALAADDVFLLRRLAARMTEGNVTLIDYLTALAINGMALQTTEGLLNDAALPPATRDALTQILANEIPWQDAMKRTLRVEYLLFSNTLVLVKRGEIGVTGPQRLSKASKIIMMFTLNENDTRRTMADFYRSLIATLGRPYGGSTTISNKFQHAFAAQALLGPNISGRVIMQTSIPAISPAIGIVYTHTAAERMMRIGLALRDYYDEHGALPAKLDDLSPQYLEKIPSDPFNNQPFHYDPAKGLLYSVGTKLADQGGSINLTRKPDDNDYTPPLNDKEQPTIQLEFQKTGNLKSQGPVPNKN